MFRWGSLARINGAGRVRAATTHSDPASWASTATTMRNTVCVLLVVLSVLTAGCGGGSKKLSNVIGKRLDIAKSELRKTGFDEFVIEVVGGNVVGALDESGWVVCDQDPSAGQAAKAVRLLVDRDCGVEDTFAARSVAATPTLTPPGVVAPPVVVAPSASPSPSVAATPSAPPTPVPVAEVPNVVGSNLQEGQDLLQARGFFNIISHDASGGRRHQVLDRSWKICDQVPTGGSRVAVDTPIDLGAVKVEESCP